MARKAEATLWVKLKIGRRSVMKRMLRKGRGYAQKSDGPYEIGSYYLRYTHNGKRIWESAGRAKSRFAFTRHLVRPLD